jgi:transposase InsO family protein
MEFRNSALKSKEYRIQDVKRHDNVKKESGNRVLIGNRMINAALWHKRFGHVNFRKMNEMRVNNVVRGLEKADFRNDKEFDCDDCNVMKATRRKFKRRKVKRVNEILGLVHTDICGPMNVESNGGSKYLLTFTDDCSRFSEVFFLKRKCEVLDKFREYKTRNERLTGKKIKVVRSDNGGEYVNEEMERYFKSEGIRHELTMPYSPQQNGIAERLNRTLCTKARCMLRSAGLGLGFWAEALSTANYIRNRSSCDSCDGKTPYEIWYGRTPCVSYFKVFGCCAYAQISKERRTGKFSERAVRGIFVGYEENRRGYRIWDLAKKCVIHSRDVKFVEGKILTEDGRELTDRNSDDNEGDFVSIRVDVPVNPSCEQREVCSQRNSFWEVEDDDKGKEDSGSDSIEENTGVQTVTAEVNQESSHVEDVSSESEIEEIDDEDGHWKGGRNLRERTDKVKPVKYGMVGKKQEFRSIFDDT